MSKKRGVVVRWGCLGALLGVLTAALWTGVPAWASSQQVEPSRVVIVTLSGISWDDILETSTPAIDELVREGASAAMAVRSATSVSAPSRGYLTLGAGARAFVAGDALVANLAFEAGSMFGEAAAIDALGQRVDLSRSGEVVHLGVARIQQAQASRRFGTIVGSFGEALARAGIARAVVSAADLASSPSQSEQRRGAVLAIMDQQGTVDHGRLEGLVVPDPSSPFGVRTDHDELIDAVAEALSDARVVVVEPGEVSRAEELVIDAYSRTAARHKEEALVRSDAIIGSIRDLLTPRDLLMVASISRSELVGAESLMPLIVSGPGFEAGRLTSGTTRNPGLVALIDVAPTVLSLLGIDRPESMSDTPFRAVGEAEDGIALALADLNDQAMFRDGFSNPVYSVYVALTIILAALAAVAFLGRKYGLVPLMHWMALCILAMPPAAIIIRALEVRHLGVAGTHVVLWGIVLALAAGARLIRGPVWAGAVSLLALSTVLYGADLLGGGNFQVAAIFGNSPIVAGRFYGLTNAGFSIVFAAGVLALLGLLDLQGRRRLPLWAGAGLVGIVLLIGLPPFGANFGGLITATFGAWVAFSLGRQGRIRWRSVLVGGSVAVAITAAVSVLDMTRALEHQTHLGRFASSVIDGGWPAVWEAIGRKAAASFGTLEYSGWTYMIPVAAVVAAVLLRNPQGPLRKAVVNHPLLRTGLWSVLVAGVVGFAVNDSGVVVPGVMVAHAIPVMILMAAGGLPTAAEPGDGPEDLPAVGRSEDAADVRVRDA